MWDVWDGQEYTAGVCTDDRLCGDRSTQFNKVCGIRVPNLTGYVG